MKENKTGVLITGGTSGLGRSLARIFTDQGYRVSVIGKSGNSKETLPANADARACDFSQLDEIRRLVASYQQENRSFKILINNAGLLSPPSYRMTGDGFELSYQVNFLAHVLLTHLLLKRDLLRPGIVVNVSSPMYRKGHTDLKDALRKEKYGILQAYANTKLYMAMLSDRLAKEGIPSCSFNPGTFSSEIYRMQKKWFHVMYRMAAPFMSPAAKVAADLVRIIEQEQWLSGEIVDRLGRSVQLNHLDDRAKDRFWKTVNEQTERYLL